MATTSTPSSTPSQHVSVDTNSNGASTPVEGTARPTGHIGRIVTASLVGGFVGAVLLVTLPFAGAREHVISGSVLLMFGASWLALAVLSQRRTDQPQRWAFVPAAFMGVAGISVLVAAPTGNPGGWVWPPAVLGLAVWMTMRARRDLHSQTRRWVVYPICIALVLSAVGGFSETYRESTDHFPMAGRLVDVGGHKLHIDCRGTGSPTVVLEPGMGEPSTAMALVAQEVAPDTRVCVYDRAGRGWSESAAGPQDGDAIATDLHTLLDRAGEQGPFVFAGHSAGGLYVMTYAHRYPDEVAGIVLLDSMHPDQYSRIDGWSAFYEMFRRSSAVMPTLSRLGVGRLMYGSAYEDLPPSARDAERAFMASPRGARSARDEFSTIRSSLAEAKQLTTLGDRPLVVVTAEQDAQGGWMSAQRRLAALSTNSTHELLPKASHSMLTEDRTTAAHSARAIAEVVDAVRAGTPLTTKAS